MQVYPSLDSLLHSEAALTALPLAPHLQELACCAAVAGDKLTISF